jgi:hypothetical protein
MIDPSILSVWRQGRPNASLSINPASIAISEYHLGRPLRPAAADTQTVKLPRRRSAASYSAQFSILYRAFGIL